MAKVFNNFKEHHLELLKDPKRAKVYLSVALQQYEQDQDAQAFLLAIRDVAEARGGLSELAARSDLNRQNLYKALSGKANPKLTTIEAILHALGFRLAVEFA